MEDTEGGEVICDPERLARVVAMPGGEAMLEIEKRFGREKAEGKPLSRYSGGVVGSLWWPETLKRLIS